MDSPKPMKTINLMSASRRVGLSRHTLLRAIERGELQTFKAGHSRMMYEADLIDWVLAYRGSNHLAKA